jgi:hypothetical protein
MQEGEEYEPDYVYEYKTPYRGKFVEIPRLRRRHLLLKLECKQKGLRHTTGVKETILKSEMSSSQKRALHNRIYNWLALEISFFEKVLSVEGKKRV